MKKRDHYLKIVKWSKEDQCYVGSIPGWIGKCCHGDDEENVYRQLCQILDEWIEIYENDNIALPASISGKKYSGKFQLRVDRDLHKTLVITGMSFRTQRTMKLDSIRQTGTGVVRSGLNGSGQHGR